MLFYSIISVINFSLDTFLEKDIKKIGELLRFHYRMAASKPTSQPLAIPFSLEHLIDFKDLN